MKEQQMIEAIGSAFRFFLWGPWRFFVAQKEWIDMGGRGCFWYRARRGGVYSFGRSFSDQ
jgi:hypothetical protein